MNTHPDEIASSSNSNSSHLEMEGALWYISGRTVVTVRVTGLRKRVVWWTRRAHALDCVRGASVPGCKVAPAAGSYLRLIDSYITQLKAQGPSRTCGESKEEEAK